ncbi:MAG: phage terminase small subunit P27 family [Rhodospirillales bacterium]|nr:phage terminase small subunit P27 family [Rhodospirillales bacterium]
MRGRKQKPTAVKLYQGNPGKRPLNRHEPLPPIGAPECPAEVSDAARVEWDRIVADLTQLNMLTSLDRAALAAYCEAYAMWTEAITAIHKFGTIVKSPTGYPMQSPYVSIANRQAEIMLRIGSEFGFTPASRSRISAPPEPAPTLFDYAEFNDEEEDS